jgi:DNA-binding response OmpR family regulator
MNHILVVEDNILLCKFYSEVLEEMGLEVTRVHTKQAAMECLKHEAPHLILLDLGLPDGNGQTIVDYIKSRADLSEARIVVITGQNERKSDKLMASVDKFLQKPLSMWSLRETVREFGLAEVTI